MTRPLASGSAEILGRERGLPPVISGHNNYWLWGPGRYDGSLAIVVGGRREQLTPCFESLEQTGVVECGRCMPCENHKPVYIARALRAPLASGMGRGEVVRLTARSRIRSRESPCLILVRRRSINCESS
jgi:hypothetical protein